MDEWIKRANDANIVLVPSDFKLIDSAWTLGGMHPDEWLDAMLSD